jgi:hypothetical protein
MEYTFVQFAKTAFLFQNQHDISFDMCIPALVLPKRHERMDSGSCLFSNGLTNKISPLQILPAWISIAFATT